MNFFRKGGSAEHPSDPSAVGAGPGTGFQRGKDEGASGNRILDFAPFIDFAGNGRAVRPIGGHAGFSADCPQVGMPAGFSMRYGPAGAGASVFQVKCQ